VTRFPRSDTRKKVMDGLRQVVSLIVKSGISCTMWTNGSFLTQEINPRDVDLVFLYPSHFADHGTPEQQALLEWLTSRVNEPKKLYLCDTHAEPIFPDNHPQYYMVPDALEYWKRVYGRSVQKGEPKGIAVVEILGETP